MQYLYLGHALAHGLVLVDEQLRSVAAFLPPDAPEPGPDMQNEVQELLGSRMTALAGLSLPQPTAPTWTLATVGVDPAHQGRGLGTAVASAGLARIDRELGAVVLETSDERNVRLYGRLGFLVTDTTVIPEGPTVYSMSRASQKQLNHP
ncbi:GNAT family N-acetyltransferase [Paenarthrobacter sp.]|uniref:GNAT family N-acetyltransferase n=1 Tax=Paenarthrobacter sp. TaxID=1931993 RepID=UPI0028116701|nr:GNAT family N-acetyltransferase [Paenarthrobacter sp.]